MRIGFYLAFPLVVILALAQSTIMWHLSILGASPNLVLLFIVCWILVRGAGEGILLAALGGVVLDFLSGAPFGVLSLALMVASAAASLSELNLFKAAPFLPYLTIIIATLLYGSISLVLLRSSGRIDDVTGVMWRSVFIETSVNVLLAPFVYGAMRVFGRLKTPWSVE